MTDLDIDPPEGWSVHRPDDQRETVLIEYRRQTAGRMTFVVSIREWARDTDGYKLRLSAINPTVTHLHHNYPVDEYDSKAEAVAGAESFIEHFSDRLREGSVSTTEPQIEEIRRAIREFTDGGLFSTVQRFVHRLR